MKNCFTICIDMDDTIENLTSSWILWLNKKYDKNVHTTDLTSWGLNTVYPELTDDQIYEPLMYREFWQTVTPKLDAVTYIQKLIDEGQDIYILTSAHHGTYKYKLEEVLFKHFPKIDRHKVIVAYAKQLISCDILIDDGLHNMDSPNASYKLLFDTPHNQCPDVLETDFYRVKNWKEIYEIIHFLDYIYTKNKFETKMY